MQCGTYYTSVLVTVDSSSAEHPVFLFAKYGNPSLDATAKPFLNPFTVSQCL